MEAFYLGGMCEKSGGDIEKVGGGERRGDGGGSYCEWGSESERRT